jgi:hypothetical protein
VKRTKVPLSFISSQPHSIANFMPAIRGVLEQERGVDISQYGLIILHGLDGAR